MKNIVGMLSVTCCLAVSFAEAQMPPLEEGWVETWHDEFNGSRLNPKDWSRIDRGKAEWCKNMSTREDLVEVKDGKLILWGKKNDDLKRDPRKCLTGGVWTKGKRNFALGRIEVCAKFEDQKGAWPAFWTVGDGIARDGRTGWPYTGEIDIVERLNGDDFVYQTAHSAWTVVEKHGKTPPQGGKGKIKQGEYNIFGLEITTNALIWTVNGEETFRYPRTDAAVTQWPFDCAQHLKLDMQLDAPWPGPVDLSTLPVATYVDWVRHSVRAIPDRKNMRLFLLVGQSNMAGRGKNYVDDNQADPSILKLDAKGNWIVSVDPVHFDKSIAGAGIATSFAREYAKAHPGEMVGLIPCAVGGTGIDRWVPGGDLFKRAVARAKQAEKNGEIVGILWHQGEGDACRRENATAYEKKLESVVKGFRKEFGREVPFVAGGLGEYLGDFKDKQGKLKIPFYRDVTATTKRVTEMLPRCAFAPSDGLKETIGDNLHFSTKSLREFGRRYYRAWSSIVQKPVK